MAPTAVGESTIVHIMAGAGLMVGLGAPGIVVALKLSRSPWFKRHANGGGYSGDTVLHGQLGEIKGELTGIKREVARVAEAVDKVHGDLDERVRDLEGWQRGQEELRRARERSE
jgi:hypothetical protein